MSWSTPDIWGNPLSDNTPPQLVLATNAVALAVNQALVSPSFTATDNQGRDISFEVLTPIVDTSVPGVTDYPYDAFDIFGNTTIAYLEVTVGVAGEAPIADAGQDAEVIEGAVVQIVASVMDPDSSIFTYRWTVPDGIILSDDEALNPTFTAPGFSGNNQYTLSLIANDGFTDSVADTVTFTVVQSNEDPNAGLFFNILTLQAFLDTASYQRPTIIVDRGALYKQRDGKVIVTLDKGQGDFSAYPNIEFALYPLSGDEAFVLRNRNTGIYVFNNQAHITLPANLMTKFGKCYFEFEIDNGTQTNLFSGYLNIIDTRIS